MLINVLYEDECFLFSVEEEYPDNDGFYSNDKDQCPDDVRF